MDCHYHRNIEPFAFKQCSRAYERIQIMHIDNIRFFEEQGISHPSDTFWGIDAAQESFYLPVKAIPAAFARKSVENDLMPMPPQHGSHPVNYSLLSTVLAVIVVDNEDFHIGLYLPFHSRTIMEFKSFNFFIGCAAE